MSRPKLSRAQRATASAARSASWLSLVAATTLGVGGVDQIRARIRSGVNVGAGELRLIVQSYARNELDGRELPKEHAEPLASTQRAVTAEELKDGVDVSFIGLSTTTKEQDSVVVAWVESGTANLDFDALEARPPVGSFYGTAHQGDHVVLRLAKS